MHDLDFGFAILLDPVVKLYLKLAEMELKLWVDK